MPIPISITLFDRGASGVPTTSNAINLAGIAESYEDTIDDRYGFSTARTSWTPSRSDILEWARADHLLRPMVASSPDGRIAWEGFLAEIEIELGTKKIAFSLKDMANRLTVRYATEGGAHGNSTTYSSTASQALYGIKDRVINASIASSAAASNQAQTILNILAFPRSKQPSSAGTSRGGLKITLTFWGWYAVLDWLLTSSTSTTTTTTSTQIGSLLTAYAGVNNFFSTSTGSIVATGVSDTEYIEPDTTYREKIERLLARGNSSQQPLAWGFYEGRVFKVETRASATPTTITYYESEASGEIRDAYGNVVDPWDVRPNAMAQVVDLIDSPLVGANETPLRKYVSRVSRRISGNDVSVTLEPEDTESLEALLTSPAGGGPAGTSAQQAAFENHISSPIRSIVPTMDNPTRYNGTTGVWQPAAGGTGVANSGTINLGSGSITTGGGSISTGGGSISTGGGSISLGGGSISTGGGNVSNTGGGAVDLGTGVGIGGTGSSGVSTSSGGGTTGRIVQWTSGTVLGDATLIKSGAGVLTLSASGTATLTIDSSTRLDGSGASSGDVLTWNGTAYAPATPGSGAPSNATYIVQTANASLSNEQALGALATGILKNTTTTGVLSIATGSDLPSHTHTASDITNFNESVDDRVAVLLTEGTNVTLTYNDASNTLTIDVPTFAPTNATYITQTSNGTLTNEQALGSLATGILKNTTTTGVLSIATGSDLPSHTHAASDITSGTMATARLGSGTANSSSYLRGDQTWATISAVTGSGTSGRVAVWNGTGSITSDAGLLFDTASNDLSVSGGLDLGGATALGTGSVAGSGNFRFNGSGTIDTGLNVGSATGAPTGVIRTSGDVNVGGGLYVGSSSASVVDGDIVCSGKMESGAGANYDIGGITFTVLSIVGYIAITHNGVARKLAVVN
jgi:hypothetical protein